MDYLFTNEQVSSSRIIYTPSVFARTNLLYIQEIGSLTAIRPHVSSRSNLLSWLFLVVTDGSGSITYDNRTYVLKAGNAVFIDCSKPYSQSSSKDLWSVSWCHFYGANLQGIYSKYRERGGYDVFRPQDVSAFTALLDAMYALASSDSHTRDMQIHLKLTELLTLLMEESWHPDQALAPVKSKVDLNEIKTYIDTHYQEKLTLEGLASFFYINKSYLARLYKEQFGITVAAYIQRVRVTKAKELLRFSDESVENIGIACGISDTNYFTRMFKKTEGVSPSAYRKMWRSAGLLQ